jgi:hypothetical protein
LDFTPHDQNEDGHDDMDPEVLSIIMKFLNFILERHSKKILVLEIEEFIVGAEQAVAIAELIASTTRLSSVILRSVKIGDSELDVICDAKLALSRLARI